jgi:hypothetical protein
MTTPPPPPGPPTVHLPQGDTEDWLDRLNDAIEDDFAPAEIPAPRRTAQPADRIPDWWTGERVILGKPDAEPEPVCEHSEPLEVHDGYGELVAYLCPDCDAQLLAPPVEEDVAPQPYAETVAAAPSAAGRGWLPAGATGITLNPRARRLVYNGSAAAIGWGLGLGPAVRDFIAACGQEAGTLPAFIVGLAVCGSVSLLVDRRTRGWWAPLAWVLRAPLASVVLALALAPF